MQSLELCEANLACAALVHPGCDFKSCTGFLDSLWLSAAISGFVGLLSITGTALNLSHAEPSQSPKPENLQGQAALSSWRGVGLQGFWEG